MAARDPRDPWWVPVPLEGPPAAKRVAVVRDAASLGGHAPSAPVARALDDAARCARRRGLRDRRRSDARIRRRVELWFDMHDPAVPAFPAGRLRARRRRWHPHGDAHLPSLAPTSASATNLKALAGRLGLVREWYAFLERAPIVLAPVSTCCRTTLGFDVESGLRTRRGVARMRDADGAAGAGTARAWRCRPVWQTACRSACRSSHRAFARTFALPRPRSSRRAPAMRERVPLDPV